MKVKLMLRRNYVCVDRFSYNEVAVVIPVILTIMLKLLDYYVENMIEVSREYAYLFLFFWLFLVMIFFRFFINKLNAIAFRYRATLKLGKKK